MSRLEPELERLVLVLADALRRRGVRFCLIGALVPELLLSQRPHRRTNDADAVVFVSSLAAYENLKRDLETDGFKPTTIVHRLEDDIAREDAAASFRWFRAGAGP